jgi:hypothetical protein
MAHYITDHWQYVRYWAFFSVSWLCIRDGRRTSEFKITIPEKKRGSHC